MKNYNRNEMGTLSISRNGVTGLTARLTILLFVLLFSSCKRDFTGEDTPTNLPGNDPIVGTGSTTASALLVYNKNKSFNTRKVGATYGDLVSFKDEDVTWEKMATVKVGERHFIVALDADGDISWKHSKFKILLINNRGKIAQETQSGNWPYFYDTFFGFSVGNRGFIFGQSLEFKRWFIQEILPNGKFAPDESDHGTWNNYYAAATPFYSYKGTYLYFQTEKVDNNDWFNASVSPDGVLTDVDGGYWKYFWPNVTSVNLNTPTGGGAYLIGVKGPSVSPHGLPVGPSTFFIQQIYSDGKMGPETYRQDFESAGGNSTICVLGYESNGRYYFITYETFTGEYTIREVKAGGTCVEVSTGSFGTGLEEMNAFSSFNMTDPGSFRYEIGWDLSPATGAPNRWSPTYSDPWSGEISKGGGAALCQIDGDYDNYPEAVLVGIDDVWGGKNKFYYKIAWNLQAERDGRAQTWSKAYFSPEINDPQSGAGADVADIDANGRPDLLLMYIDDPDGVNQFRYHIGWNLSATTGQAASWSSMIAGPDLGHSNSGGGAALGDIDKNGRPDLVLMGVDNPEQGNSFWYCVGKNLDKTGKPTAWTPAINAPCYLGWSSAGGGAALADINGNGKLDLVLSGIDSPTGANNFWCYIGWDIDINGNVTGWSPKFVGPAVGYITEGGGTAVGDIDHNGKMDILLMGLENPYGND